MSYLGLTPSESSSGERQQRDGITKTGNRQENVPRPIRNIAWKAQVRLYKRYRIMAKKDKPKNVITVSIARELAGFMWAVAQEVNIPIK